MRCRLPCTVKRGRKRIRARVLDVSEGGLCIVAPVRFRNRATIQIVIEDPRHGPVEIEGVVWHDRPFKQPSSGRKGFATGLVLAKGGLEFRALANPGLHAEPIPRAPEAPRPDAEPARASPAPGALPELDADGPSLYRVRVKVVGAPRIRTLTLSAVSEAAVREAVLSDLEGHWEVLDVEADPLD
jgi:hypothetical protein